MDKKQIGNKITVKKRHPLGCPFLCVCRCCAELFQIHTIEIAVVCPTAPCGNELDITLQHDNALKMRMEVAFPLCRIADGVFHTVSHNHTRKAMYYAEKDIFITFILCYTLYKGGYP